MISFAYAWAYKAALEYEGTEELSKRFRPEYFFVTGFIDFAIVALVAWLLRRT